MQKIAQFIAKIIDFLYQPFAKLLPKQLFCYGACGGGNMILDWILYFVFYNFIIGHELVYIGTICLTPHIATLCVVFPITLCTGFWLNKYVTFTHSSLQSSTQIVRYISIVALNLAINYFGLKLCVEIWGWYPTPSKICITILTVIISFFCQKYFTFKE